MTGTLSVQSVAESERPQRLYGTGKDTTSAQNIGRHASLKTSYVLSQTCRLRRGYSLVRQHASRAVSRMEGLLTQTSLCQDVLCLAMLIHCLLLMLLT